MTNQEIRVAIKGILLDYRAEVRIEPLETAIDQIVALFTRLYREGLNDQSKDTSINKIS